MTTVVVTLTDAAAVRASELARTHCWLSPDEVVAELVLAAPAPPEDVEAGRAALRSLFGCGTGQAAESQQSVAELRRDLAARRLAKGIENV